jgi:hypothetical protein
MPRVALLICAAAAGALAGCSSSGPELPSSTGGVGTVPQAPTPAGLPFHYQFGGQSSSPAFRVSIAGTYTVAYTLKGSTNTPGCNVTIALVADDGSSQVVVPGVTLQPTDSKQGSAQVQLTAATWRFQEGGGCSWDVTVSQGS